MKQDSLNRPALHTIDLTKDSFFANKRKLIIDGLLLSLDYKDLSAFFRYHKNAFAAGEFWGKIMRATAAIYRECNDERLLLWMKEAVLDLLSIQGDDGELSTGPKEEQPNASSGADLWERKYVMLGMLSYYEVSQDPIVITPLCKLLDYTISQVGEEPSKTSILDTGWAFYGIESSSILEPVVDLYKITKEQRYLDFATYIVKSGACKRENMFQAILKGTRPYLIGWNGNPKESIAKAYEMMSCFEGLIEYYRVTGEEWCKDAAVHLWDMLLEDEITYLGSGGCDRAHNLGPGTGEQWNLTKCEQSDPDVDAMMETCVTVTWMKFSYQLLRLTGDPKYAREMERSAFNALIGALHPTGCMFEYYPRYFGVRRNKVGFAYPCGTGSISCCTANGPSGFGVFVESTYMNTEKELYINQYLPSNYDDEWVHLELQTEFPRKVDTIIKGYFKKPGIKALYLRAREDGTQETLSVSGCTFKEDSSQSGYLEFRGPFEDSFTITYKGALIDEFHMATGCTNPEGNNRMLLTHGPIVMSFEGVSLALPRDEDPFCILKEPSPNAQVKLSYNGIPLKDYASCGATWDEELPFCTWFEML